MYITTREAYNTGSKKFEDLRAAATVPGTPLEVIQAYSEFAAHWLPRATEYRRLERAAHAAEIKQIRIENDIKRCEEDLRKLKTQLRGVDQQVDTAEDDIMCFCMSEHAEEERAAEAAVVDPWTVKRDPWGPGPSYDEVQVWLNSVPASR